MFTSVNMLTTVYNSAKAKQWHSYITAAFCKTETCYSEHENSCSFDVCMHFIYYLLDTFCCLQCFDAVGWVAGRASGL